jgi:hypothetical protein
MAIVPQPVMNTAEAIVKLVAQILLFKKQFKVSLRLKQAALTAQCVGTTALLLLAALLEQLGWCICDLRYNMHTRRTAGAKFGACNPCYRSCCLATLGKLAELVRSNG